MDYHKITKTDCLSVATKDERLRLDMITDISLLKRLAKKWCDDKGFRLGGYLGNNCWDATSAR